MFGWKLKKSLNFASSCCQLLRAQAVAVCRLELLAFPSRLEKAIYTASITGISKEMLVWPSGNEEDMMKRKRWVVKVEVNWEDRNVVMQVVASESGGSGLFDVYVKLEKLEKLE